MISAGILLFRRVGPRIQVLIAHPGGPLWAARDAGAWTIPKGEAEPHESSDEALFAVARREFREETGTTAPATEPLDLGEVRLRSGKRVRAWAMEGDLDPRTLASNTFELEWPPKSGRRMSFPEVDRLAWVDPADAMRRVNPAQAAFVERLLTALRED